MRRECATTYDGCWDAVETVDLCAELAVCHSRGGFLRVCAYASVETGSVQEGMQVLGIVKEGY